jgi:hypothetical protein
MPADIAKAFLNNSEECDFAIFLQSSHFLRDFDLNANPASLLKSSGIHSGLWTKGLWSTDNRSL